ncbi:MAG TPA: hypothetical protein PLI09_28685 [Candidatus Hydrogenedentes bacterium]|nr:hypothetical protein [Candidatus Hydrogenedentota bacterium]
MRFLIRFAQSMGPAVLLFAFIIVFAGTLTGCGQIPISFTVALQQDITMPVMGPIAGQSINDLTVQLPKDICNLPTRAQVDDKITAYVPAFLLNLVKIEQLTIDRVLLTATQGDFNDITYTSLDLLVQDVPDPVNIGEASAPPAFGAEMVIKATPPPDLLDLLFNTIDGKCVGVQVTVNGVVPDEALTFNMSADVTVVIKLSLF